MTNNPIVKIVVLLIVGYLINEFLPKPAIKKICLIVVALAILVVLLLWLFPGII